MNLLYTLEELQAMAEKRLVAIEILEEQVEELKAEIKLLNKHMKGGEELKAEIKRLNEHIKGEGDDR